MNALNNQSNCEIQEWHVCWKYKDSIKTIKCKLCDTKVRNEKAKLKVSKMAKNSADNI